MSPSTPGTVRRGWSGAAPRRSCRCLSGEGGRGSWRVVGGGVVRGDGGVRRHRGWRRVRARSGAAPGWCRHERTAKALGAGDRSSGHVEVLADASRHREALYAEHEDLLLDAATSLGVDDFASAGQDVAALRRRCAHERGGVRFGGACVPRRGTDVRRPAGDECRARRRRRRDRPRGARCPVPARSLGRRTPAALVVATARDRVDRDGGRVTGTNADRRAAGCRSASTWSSTSLTCAVTRSPIRVRCGCAGVGLLARDGSAPGV